MNKKIILLIIICCFTLGIILGFIYYKSTSSKEKISLSDKYYNVSSFIEVDEDKINNSLDETYILFTYNNYCSLPISCESIFKSFSEKYNIGILKIAYADFKNTYLYETVSFAPSIIIVQNGKIIDYLKADSDDDLEKYQDLKVFKKWINSYINI